tara:strand:+ start:405 stop:2165 length:1761 start_codon:yes stop_codon:yes gene_type:complete
MSYGIKTFSADGYVNLHSDYSSLVYVGEFAKTTNPVRPVYEGDYAIAILDYNKVNNYDQGWLVQYTFDFDTANLIPFYRPNYDGQELGIIDVVNEGTTWVVNVLFKGDVGNFPRIFAFAPLTDIPSVTLSDNGLAVYDEDENLVFTDSQPPLRVDDVLSVQHPTSIRAAARGTCGRDGTSCHLNYTSDQSNTYTGTATNTNTKLYHAVPSAYGGLAFDDNGTYERSCGFLGWGDRKYAWAYRSWSSFRGTMTHPYNTTNHNTGWLGDFSGAMYQQKSGSCGYGGFLGALIGIVAVVFTGGVGLALIGGALAGFVVGTLTSPTSPGLKAYEADAMFDQNSTYELIVTDATYYNIDGASGIDDSIDYDNLTFNYSTLSNTYWEHSSIEGPDGSSIVDTINIYWNGAQITDYNTVSQFATNYTDANGDTYIRGELRDSSTITTYNNLVGNFVTFSDKYSIARVAIGDEPSGDASDDNADDVDDGSFVPDDVPEIYAGVDQWKGGTFSGSTWWTTYYSGATLTEANARMFIWYAGSLAYGDFTGAYTSLNTTSVTGNDGRTYFKGAPHPEDGNPWDNGSFKYLFFGVGRE